MKVVRIFAGLLGLLVVSRSGYAAEGSADAILLQLRPGGAVSLTAAAVPASELLDDLARRTGMTVVYNDVAPPGDIIDIRIEAESMSAALRELLKAVGANYAFKMRASGGSVDTLIIVGTDPVKLARLKADTARRAAETGAAPGPMLDDSVMVDPDTGQVLAKPQRLPGPEPTQAESASTGPRPRGPRPPDLRQRPNPQPAPSNPPRADR